MNVREQELQSVVDPALTDARLTALARRALGVDAGEVRGCSVLTGGCWNRVVAVRLGRRELVCKISPVRRDEKILREYRVLKHFRKRTALEVPEPLLLDTGELMPGSTLVMTRIPGVVMHECFGYLDAASRRKIRDSIAADLADLHDHRAAGFGGVELKAAERCPDWPAFWIPRFDRVLDEAEESGRVPEGLIDGARRIRPDLERFLGCGSEGTLTHYDIWSGNVMVDASTRPARVTGYIDLPGFYADPVRELSFAMLFGVADRRFLDLYAERHPLGADFELRAAVYNLKMTIRHAQMYPGEPGYRRAAEDCLSAIRRLADA